MKLIQGSSEWIKYYSAQITTYIFTEATTKSESGNYIVTEEEINKRFNIVLTAELKTAVITQLYSWFQFTDILYYDHQFDVILGTDYVLDYLDIEGNEYLDDEDEE